ncbi:hypothetical protein Pmani_015269 [Petrolisthes manimaculis]|uniref:C-type lectin domain-containing protein n=1 Tax=Petrolisthes manimaculis TaxID=1843537 RepID=A0AAE1PUS9_9EUCA|nr:hypothetical protein Pmani_015269 [Petrolisthes manimaculis]
MPFDYIPSYRRTHSKSRIKMFANNILPVIMLVCCGSLLVTAVKYHQRIEDFDIDQGKLHERDSGTLRRDLHHPSWAVLQVHQSRRNWDTASTVCESEGAQLASVITQDQYDALLGHINANYAGTYWTSGRTEGGRWVWTSTHEPRVSVASQWWGRSPSTAMGQCAYFCSNTLKYWNKSCSHSLRFICEKIPTSTVNGGFDPRVAVEAQ